MTEVEIAWVAGLFEGEGCISLGKPPKKSEGYQPKKSRKGSRGGRYLYLSLAMTDEDVIGRLFGLVGCGSVHRKSAKYYEDKGYKPQWVWVLTGKKAEQLMWKCLPLLGQRRRDRFAEVMGKVMGDDDCDT